MSIAIISDIHDNLVNLEKCLNWCRAEKVKDLICCGDITNLETVEFISQHFLGQIFLVRGNCTIFDDRDILELKNITNLGEAGRFSLEGHWVGLCHQPFEIEKVKALGQCEIIFFGHTHKPSLEDIDGSLIVNPGTLGGVFNEATFTYWDPCENKLELKVLGLL
ncbi:MAG: YfcE family phosphodiesterase [Candidatus Falkowbacteria bacterium]|nr:YfcE family phosphodiesterase [Candidatus Falkowbacteria bacterium]